MPIQSWTFGPFRFDGRDRRLTRDGAPVALQPKPAEVLHRLLREGGGVVNRAALTDAVSPGVVVVDGALRNAVHKLREALGDHADWVENLPRRGVRFAGPLVVHADGPAAPVLSVRSTLVAERGSFVGRTAELAHLADALSRSRFVSLLGPGGAGKTRLAVRHAWRSLEDWPGGVRFCDWSTSRVPAEAVAVVARCLDVPWAPDVDADLGRALAAHGRGLLVLDNLEQLLPAIGEVLARWLDAAPELHLLATSRTRSEVPGEVVVDVGPLDPEAATALFVDRARDAAPGFAEPAPGALDPLLARLDGLPLAIELAAARMRTMTPDELGARLGHGDPLAAAGGRPARHRSLRAALDHSWALSSERERAALGELTVFAGPFSFAAAEAVLSDPDPVRCVASLVDKSLVRSRPAEPRPLDLLATIREYAAERVGASDAARDRHVHHYAAIAEASARRPDAAARLGPDARNLQVACAHAAERGDAGAAAVLLRGLWRAEEDAPALDALASAVGQLDTAEARYLAGAIAVERGRVTEGLEHLAEATALDADGSCAAEIAVARGAGLLRANRPADAWAALGPPGDGEEPADALVLRGNVAFALGRYEDAFGWHQRALRAAEDQRAELAALGGVAAAVHQLGRHDEALAWYERALALAHARRALQEPVHRMRLGILYDHCGRAADAEAALLTALGQFRARGDRSGEGNALTNLANAYAEAGRADEARARFHEALAVHRSVGNRRSEANTLGCLGELWSRTPEHRGRAARCFEDAAAVYRSLGLPRMEALVRAELVELAAGQDPRAVGWLREIEALIASDGNAVDRSRVRRAAAVLWLRVGDLASAEAAAAEALALVGGSQSGERGSALVVAAEVAWARGRADDARRLLGQAAESAASRPLSAVGAEVTRLRRVFAGATPFSR